jgi:hypothetical protein
MGWARLPQLEEFRFDFGRMDELPFALPDHEAGTSA